MIVKKLRTQHRWSQEQLAQMSGLGLRTVQRIEAGNRANTESLKSLAAVFEVDVSSLEQSVVLVDKESAQWQKAPWWVRGIFIGSNTIKFKRQDAVIFELLLIAVGVGLFIVGVVVGDEGPAVVLSRVAGVFLACGYYMSVKLRIGDKYQVW